MDYKKLGLKCGIEIHQQLEGAKLFCSCPTTLRDDEPIFRLRRKMRASAGEGGVIDVAAKQEQLRNKTFIYEGYDSTCLVETDSEPPHEVNQEALYSVLQFCEFVQSDLSPIVQVMRKTVVDGSNTSGFQRTALVARGGKIETSEGDVRIANISLEEDACKIVSENDEEKVYRMDRLGIPLIEIGTEPDIKTPEQCQEASKKIGMLLRSLPGVKRGLGTIRQDVNVSIAGGTRIEIKGAQDLKGIPALVNLEIKRQSELLKIKDELRGTRLNKLEIVDLSLILQSVDSKVITSAYAKQGKVLAFKLNNFAGFLGRELQPGYRLGSELSGRAKIKAGVKGLFHSDELPNYGIEKEDVTKIRKKLKCDTNDAFILIADEDIKARIALQAAYERATQVLVGIPKEVRKAQPNGTSTYMRPMPGAARMYPETDVPLFKPESIDIDLPELLEEKIKRFQEDTGLNFDLASFIAKSNNVDLFETLVKKHPKIKPAFIAETLTSTLLEIKRKYSVDSSTLTDGDFINLFKYLEEDKINKDIVLDVLIDMSKGTFDLKKYEGLSPDQIKADIKEIVDKNKALPMGALMGMCMKKFAGKASGKVISDIIKTLTEND